MIHIDVGDRVVEVPPVQTVENKAGKLVQIDPRRTIDLGFVITTHKAQGSEWPHVIYIMNKTSSFMQSRHNLYTGISRARTTATLISDQRSLQNSVMNAMSLADRRNS
jgi:exodeoxyribonuclease V alpha subunit